MHRKPRFVPQALVLVDQSLDGGFVLLINLRAIRDQYDGVSERLGFCHVAGCRRMQAVGMQDAGQTFNSPPTILITL